MSKVSKIVDKAVESDFNHVSLFKKDIDELVNIQKMQADLKIKEDKIRSKIIADAKVRYEKDGKANNYRSSYIYEGDKTSGMMVIFQSKYYPVTKDLFESHPDIVNEVRSLKVKDTSDHVIEELVTLLGEEKFLKYFKVEVSYQVRPGFAQSQFELPDEVRNLFVQYNPSFKMLGE